jgi:ABC-type lipoprotein release transport system permease subunit
MTWTYIKLAWRNLFRNRRRSFIAGTAIGIGLASLVFMDALILGMEDNMIRSATASFLGEGQIHREGFRTTQAVEKTVNRLDQVLADLGQETIVAHFAPRVIALGMITSAANMHSVQLVGIEPSAERGVSQIDEALREGSFFEGTRERDIVIGSELAELLEVALNDRIVVTVAQAETGDLSQEMFRVSGIYHLDIREMDRGMAFIRLSRAQRLLGLGEGVHEIAVQFRDTRLDERKKQLFWGKYGRHGNEAIGWRELLPQLEAALELSQFSTYLTGLILFGVVSLGIINTLFMSLHERIFEFGVLRAVGTRPRGVARLILFEAGALALLSIGLGVVLGLVVVYVTSQTGIDYTGIEFAGVTFRESLYPVLHARSFTLYSGWVFVVTLLVGIYPAVHAARIPPADALRRSL